MGWGLKLEVANDGAVFTARRRPSQLTVTKRGELWVTAAVAAATTSAAATFSEKILAPNEEGRGEEERGKEGGRGARQSQERSAR